MAELVRASGGALAGFGDPRLGCGAAGALAEAVRHAVDVMAPVASDERIRLDAEISPDLGALRAGNVYTVITNGVRNAIESIQRAGTPDGRIDVIARVELGRTGRCVLIEIIDNGQGPPPPAPPRKSVGAPERSADPYAHVFGLGYTTKPDGTGIGLSVARDLVDELGGTIELCAREAHGGVTPRGAVLRVRFPCPTAMPGEAATGSARRVHGTDDRHSA
jgi:two-component system CitB family sensor kinase